MTGVVRMSSVRVRTHCAAAMPDMYTKQSNPTVEDRNKNTIPMLRRARIIKFPRLCNVMNDPPAPMPPTPSDNER